MAKLKWTDDNKRFAVVAGVLVVFFLGAKFTQAEVQVLGRGRILDEATSNRKSGFDRKERAYRGAIFSSDGKVLAQTQDAYELSLSYERLPLSPGFYMALSRAVGISEPELSVPAMEGKRSRTWRKRLTAEQAEQVRDVRRRWKADGVSISAVLDRAYPLEEFTAGIVGAVRDSEPLNGLELSQNKVLSGTPGEQTGFIDRTGFFVPDENAKGKPAENGKNLVLTLDSTLQITAVNAVRKAVEKHRAVSGTAIVMDPKTGDILAMANWPTFNPELPIAQGSDLNASYMSVFEPGSTFKILTLAEALDQGVVTENEHINCGGTLTITNGKFISCDHGGHGSVSLEEAIAKSCNVSASTWALRIGNEKFVEFMQNMQLFERPNLGLPGEVRGLYNFNDGGKRMQLANNGFGQAMNVAPVTLASAFSMLANEGVRMKPRLIRSVGGKETPIAEAGRIVKPEVAHTVMKLMESTIEADYGTGAGLRIRGYRLAGKTGTAQRLGHSGGGYVSNFIGYVPAQNPKVTILVMINNPTTGGYYGGAVAGPVFNELAKSVIQRYNIPSDRAAELAHDAATKNSPQLRASIAPPAELPDTPAVETPRRAVDPASNPVTTIAPRERAVPPAAPRQPERAEAPRRATTPRQPERERTVTERVEAPRRAITARQPERTEAPRRPATQRQPEQRRTPEKPETRRATPPRETPTPRRTTTPREPERTAAPRRPRATPERRPQEPTRATTTKKEPTPKRAQPDAKREPKKEPKQEPKRKPTPTRTETRRPAAG